MERMNGKFNILNDKVDKLDVKVEKVEGRISGLETKVEKVEGRISSLEAKVDSGFNKADKKFEEIDKRFDKMDNRFDHMEEMLTSLIKITANQNKTSNELMLEIKSIKKDTYRNQHDIEFLTNKFAQNERMLNSLINS